MAKSFGTNKTRKESNIELQQWAASRREFLKEQHNRFEAPLFKRI